MKILSPVYFKEIGQLASSRKLVAVKALLLAVILVDYLIVLTVSRSSYDIGSGKMGQALFVSLAFIELTAMAIFTPIVTAGMVCGEQQAGTLGLLFLTKLKSWNIVQDKGLSRITFMVLVGIVSLPFMFAALLFGGVETRQIIVAAGNILAVTLLCGGVSLLCSTLMKRYGAALAAAYSAIFLYMLVLPVLAMIMGEILSLGRLDFDFVPWINPFVSTGMSMSAHELRSKPWLTSTWSVNLAIGVSVYVLAVLVASPLLRRIAFPNTAAAGTQKRRISFRKLCRNPLPLHPAALCHRSGPIGENPVTWKESGLLDDYLKVALYRTGDLLFAVYGLLLLLVAAAESSGLRDEDLHVAGHGFAFAVAVTFTAILSASSFSREREAGTFSIMLSTRLTGHTIVMGTFAGLMRSICPFAAVLAAVLLIGQALAPDTEVLIPLVNIAVYLTFVVVLGMWMSLKRQTTAKAIGWTLAVILFLVLGIPVIAFIAGEVLDLGNNVAEAILACSPDYWVMTGPDDRSYDRDFGGTLGHVLVTALYAAATVCLLLRMAVTFDETVGRQPASST